MADLLEKGASWLDRQRHDHMSRTVEYVRGAATVTVAATIGQTTFEQESEVGGIQQFQSRDFLVRTAELILDGQATLPQAGDQIRETVDTTVFVYEVMAPGSQPAFRYSDPYRNALRIHTKHVATEDV